jgi:hypothetical protein
MTADFPDRIVNKRLLDRRLVATADQPYGQLRLEAQNRDLGQTQTDSELSLRRAAEMETGRARNIYTVV